MSASPDQLEFRAAMKAALVEHNNALYPRDEASSARAKNSWSDPLKRASRLAKLAAHADVRRAAKALRMAPKDRDLKQDLTSAQNRLAAILAQAKAERKAALGNVVKNIAAAKAAYSEAEAAYSAAQALAATGDAQDQDDAARAWDEMWLAEQRLNATKGKIMNTKPDAFAAFNAKRAATLAAKGKRPAPVTSCNWDDNDPRTAALQENSK